MAFRTLNRREAVACFLAAVLRAQDEPPVQWVCPMDPDVRAANPDRCKKCGMKLVAGIPDPEEYPVEMTVSPAAAQPGREVTLRFRIAHPKTGKPARLQLIHEKLFHLFVVSSDLAVFRHDHPELQDDGSFLHKMVLPEGGMYRVLCDFYPENATPQMVAKTLILPGPGSARRLTSDLSPQRAENVQVSLHMEPEQPLAGKKTMLFCSLEPADGLEQYLGAWGHLLAASEDLIDMIHSHPASEEGGPKIQFNVIFPRPGMHRVWVQFQRSGVVNTVAFNIRAKEL